MANFLTGSCIEVLPTDNTHSRFPDQIGCLGVVEHAPIHPSTWFTIKMTDGRSIKLQTTAMKHVAKNDSRHQTMHNIIPMQAHKHPIPTSAIPMDIQKENHRPRSNSNVGIAHFTKGVAVIILRTDNVLHRVPHLVGVVGIIKEVPVHPITWFKIEFPSGQVATFRPSAFKLNDGKDEEVQRPSKKPTAFSANFNLLHSKKHVSLKKEDRSNEYEYATGMQVIIRSGELSGERGEVLKSSNGWIQVITALGKVAKRAHELDFADCSYSPKSEHREFFPSNSSHKYDDRRSDSGVSTTSSNDHKAVFLSHQKSGAGPRNLHNRLSEKSNMGPEGKRNHGDMSPGSGMAPLYDLERQSADCPFPLVPLHVRQAKRRRLQAFVDSETEVISNRPDLSYWLGEINCALRAKENASSATVLPRTPSSSDATARTSSSVENVQRTSRVSVNDRREIPQGIFFPTSSVEVPSGVMLDTLPESNEILSDDESEVNAPTGTGDSSANVSDVENKDPRDRSNSLSETDREEETYSPDAPSHVNVPDFSGRSVPSPFSLPPADNVYSLEGFPPLNLNSNVKNVNMMRHGNTDSNKFVDNETSDMNNNEHQPKSKYNKSIFSSIPNPVKVFIPRQYSSHSCPTFSPFQNSSFPSFTSATQDLKSPILQDHNEWANFFSQEKNKSYSVNNTPFVNSAFLPFTSVAKMS